MADPHILDIFDIPSRVLIALDWRPYRFAVQPYHYLIRAAHLVSMAAFFGGIAALDLRLLGWKPPLSLRAFAEQVLPWIYVTFTISVVTGLALFFYDPLAVGSHAYFSFKLILTVLGVINAALFQRSGYLASLPVDETIAGPPTTHARLIGAISLLLWTGVVVCACLNVEGVPKRLLR
jgi:uncharacterized membrane protein